MRILLGITGGIAAYKAANLIRGFSELGHQVTVLPTENALRFIGRPTLEALSGRPINIDMYSDVADVRHVTLGQDADLIVIAPATASFLARLANGLADDLLTNAVLASNAPVVVCPAMHTEMWQNQATQHNVAKLRARGVKVMEPASGRLTGGDAGPGRLPETQDILDFVLGGLLLSGKKVLVTAGGTREPIDEVRFLGNSSTGRQGIEIAKAARDAGAEVTLVACNIDSDLPKGMEIRRAVTVSDLQQCMGGEFDAVVMTAAVSDFHVVNKAEGKITSKVIPNLILGENPDVIAKYRKSHPETFICGFALEDTSGIDLIYRARQKLSRKGLDLVVANQISALGSTSNAGYFVEKENEIEFSGTKEAISRQLVDLIAKKLS